MRSLSRNVNSGGTASASAGFATFFGAGFFGAAFFFEDPMIQTPEKFRDNTITPGEGLGEFLHIWLAYLAIVALLPGVLLLAVCVAFGAMFAAVINPWRAAVYLGAAIEGTKRLVQACALGVLHDPEEEARVSKGADTES